MRMARILRWVGLILAGLTVLLAGSAVVADAWAPVRAAWGIMEDWPLLGRGALDGADLDVSQASCEGASDPLHTQDASLVGGTRSLGRSRASTGMGSEQR